MRRSKNIIDLVDHFCLVRSLIAGILGSGDFGEPVADGWWLPGATMVTLVISTPMHHLVANHGVVTDWRHDRPTLAPPITLIRPLSLLMRQRIISTPHITHRTNHQPTQYLKHPSSSFPHSQLPSGNAGHLHHRHCSSSGQNRG